MKRLTMNDIYNMCLQLKEQGKDLNKLPIYLGDDDELNGVHSGWYCEYITKQDEEDNDTISIFEESNIELADEGILIS